MLLTNSIEKMKNDRKLYLSLSSSVIDGIPFDVNRLFFWFF